MNASSPIGVFDSGMGGLSVLHTIHEILPNEDLIFYGDSKYNPYGTKSKEEITSRCIEICDHLVGEGVKAIVIACNTATSACVSLLRDRYDIDIIGMEPALKVACEKGEHQRIAVWATDFTLKEKKFSNLMKQFEEDHVIHKIPCPKLVRIVEENRLLDTSYVEEILQSYLNMASNVDDIVLGCTHFVYFRKYLQKMVPHVCLIDGNVGTANHLYTKLLNKGLLNENGGLIQWQNSDIEKIKLSKSLFSYLQSLYSLSDVE